MKKQLRNLLKRKSNEPRQLDVIRNDYGAFAAKAGQVQYQLHTYNKELARLNGEMEKLNVEASEREKLNAEAAKQTALVVTPQTEVKNV